MTCVTWNDAKAYVDWLNTITPLGGFRLPTEAEWEYAARGGEQGAYYWAGVTSDPEASLCSYANGLDRSASESEVLPEGWVFAECSDTAVFTSPAPLADAENPSRLPNAFFLSDMSGNVWEWVEDAYEPDYANTPTDGSARLPQLSSLPVRVVRGGSWDDEPQVLRSASRFRVAPVNRINIIGFRPARTLVTP